MRREKGTSLFPFSHDLLVGDCVLTARINNSSRGLEILRLVLTKSNVGVLELGY